MIAPRNFKHWWAAFKVRKKRSNKGRPSVTLDQISIKKMWSKFLFILICVYVYSFGFTAAGNCHHLKSLKWCVMSNSSRLISCCHESIWNLFRAMFGVRIKVGANTVEMLCTVIRLASLRSERLCKWARRYLSVCVCAGGRCVAIASRNATIRSLDVPFSVHNESQNEN